MHTVISFPVSYWNLLITVLLPALTALVTHRFAESWVKALTLLALSVVGGFVNQVIAQGGHVVVGQSLWYIVITFAGAVAVHFGLLAPTQITGIEGIISRWIPGGLGPVRLPSPQEGPTPRT